MKENINMKFYVCKRIRLLNYLQNNGFNYIKTEQDKNNPNYLVWIFIDSKKLRSTIEEYYNQIK